MQMTRRDLYWTLQISGWTLYTLINIGWSVLADRLENIPVHLIIGVFLLLSTHGLRIIIKAGDWLNLRPRRLIIRLLVANLILAATGFFFHAGVAFFFIKNVTYTSFEISAGLFAYFFLYLTWILIYLLYHYFVRIASSKEIELQSLKSQINPHFIFNALNSIRALIDENPQKSKNAITQLSHLMRQSMMMDNKRLVTLEEELKTVKDYLDLETIRYEERLASSIHITQEALQCQVPPMMVQTLVENGIKHGISKLRSGGILRIDGRRHNGCLELEIRNSGQLQPTQNLFRSKGYGLANTYKRLHLIYGNQAEFSIENESPDTVKAKLLIPQTL